MESRNGNNGTKKINESKNGQSGKMKKSEGKLLRQAAEFVQSDELLRMAAIAKDGDAATQDEFCKRIEKVYAEIAELSIAHALEQEWCTMEDICRWNDKGVEHSNIGLMLLAVSRRDQGKQQIAAQKGVGLWKIRNEVEQRYGVEIIDADMDEVVEKRLGGR
jgi:hypothetical protein